MDLRQFNHFVAVAEEQSFTRAARRVNIVQSALSTSIRALEEELGARLLSRHTRSVELTSIGRLFLDKTRIILDNVQDARDGVAKLQGLERGLISIGTVQSLPAFVDLPCLLAKFSAMHPGIDFRLSQAGGPQLLERIVSGRLDLAFLPACEAPAGVATRMITCEDLVVVCAHTHPLAGRQSIGLDALVDERFVDFAADHGTRALVDSGFHNAGLERHVAFEVGDLNTMLELVSRGLGIALVPETIAAARANDLAGIELTGQELCWEVVVASVDGDMRMGHAATQALLDLVDDVYPKFPQAD